MRSSGRHPHCSQSEHPKELLLRTRRDTLAAILGREPHAILPVEVKVEAVVQRVRRLAEFLLEGVEALRLQHLAVAPDAPAIMAPAVIASNLLLGPALLVTLASVAKVEDKAHTTCCVFDLAHHAAVEDLHIVGVCGLRVIRKVAHPHLAAACCDGCEVGAKLVG